MADLDNYENEKEIEFNYSNPKNSVESFLLFAADEIRGDSGWVIRETTIKEGDIQGFPDSVKDGFYKILDNPSLLNPYFGRNKKIREINVNKEDKYIDIYWKFISEEEFNSYNNRDKIFGSYEEYLGF